MKRENSIWDDIGIVVLLIIFIIAGFAIGRMTIPVTIPGQSEPRKEVSRGEVVGDPLPVSSHSLMPADYHSVEIFRFKGNYFIRDERFNIWRAVNWDDTKQVLDTIFATTTTKIPTKKKEINSHKFE